MVCDLCDEYMDVWDVLGMCVVYMMFDDMVFDMKFDVCLVVIVFMYDLKFDDFVLMEVLKMFVFYVGVFGLWCNNVVWCECLCEFDLNEVELVWLYGLVGIYIGSWMLLEIVILIFVEIIVVKNNVLLLMIL